MNDPLLDHARRVLGAQPFSALLDAQIAHIDAHGVELRLPAGARVRQQHGFVHGGVLAYAADNAITFAGGAALGPSVVTAGLTLHYLRPARGHTIVARARVEHAGRRQAVCRCEVLALDDDEERLCALAQGTVALLGNVEHP